MKLSELGVVDPPGILVQLGILRNHIRLGGVEARDCR